jgi:hypothetical protein
MNMFGIVIVLDAFFSLKLYCFYLKLSPLYIQCTNKSSLCFLCHIARNIAVHHLKAPKISLSTRSNLTDDICKESQSQEK